MATRTVGDLELGIQEGSGESGDVGRATVGAGGGGGALGARGSAVNQEALKQSVRRWPTATAFQWLASFLERAGRDPNVVAVIVIGSAARPNVASDDLDLMVLCRDTQLLREKAPIEVDVRKANVDSVEADIRSRQDVAIWTVRFGRPLLDKNGIWNSITSRWRSRLPLPDPAVALDRAAAAQVRMEKMCAVGDEGARRELEISYRTHLARAALASAGIQPASRPELSSQLRELGETELASDLERALSYRRVGPLGGEQ